MSNLGAILRQALSNLSYTIFSQGKLLKKLRQPKLVVSFFLRKMSLVTEEIKAKAEVYYGDEMGKEKSQELLREVGLPNGLLPLHDIIECGIVRETGFVWLKQKKSITHKFEKVGKLASYDTEVTAYVEPKKIKKLTGVKTKELMIWVKLSDIYLDDPPTGKITFQTPTGLYRTFPESAFVVEEKSKGGAAAKDVKEEKKEDAKNQNKEVKEVNGAVEVKKP